MAELPPLRELGSDLIRLTHRQRLVTLALPFACAGAYLGAALLGWWPAAVLATMALSYSTYGSTSHDLVHRSLGLPRWLNEIFLCAIELLAVRSGHAYRSAHLHHHAAFPAADDIEGAAARMTWLGALIDGLTLQYRIWWRAASHRGRDRPWVLAEGFACVALVAGAVVLVPVTRIGVVYVGLMVAGSWIIPLVTSYFVHDATGDGPLTQTRAFRGRVASVVSLEHLYHLEHHMYPAVPHQNWPELARRLDPHLTRAGVRPIRFGR